MLVSADNLLLHTINKFATPQSQIFIFLECEKAMGESRERQIKAGYNFI